ncbi:FKBP-type peptidyl-prolyl cis-trans isomerase N-terminal domain-containing protein [Arenimonas sp.]|jgi:FKBP-type peptidyl-prolyl cis-trans isomerase|uniref:FKBP-type peptidyl-prolyl cis-trans isomerase N-terminal domain-containing protein n=1 Tax=Arenimonas sp. TaxID=1872635 RepID=UPI0037BE3AF3
MKLQLLSAVLASTLATAALAQTAPAAKPATPVASGPVDKAALAYALGYDFGRNMADQAPGLDVTAINRAIQDGYAKRPPTIAPEKLEATMVAYQKQREAEAKSRFDTAARENKLKSDAVIASNKTKPGVVTLPSGIQYKVVEAGAGARPNLNSTVEFNFSGALATTGQPFVSTFADVKPVSGKLSDVVKLPGMQEIMQQMPNGARWQVLLPPEKAWGSGVDSVRGGPGPNQAILLDIKLISVK